MVRFVCATAIGLLVALAAFAIEPIPSFYDEPGINPNRDYVNQHISERVDPFTGKLQIHLVDLFLPGVAGLNIQVQRSYSSVNEDLVEPTAVGYGWTINFGRVLRRAPNLICDNQNTLAGRMPVLELPDGSRQILYLSPDHTYWITTSRWKATCSSLGGLNVFSPDGTLYEMTTPGLSQGGGANVQNAWYVTRVVDRNGNWLQFEYVNVAFATAVSRITASDLRQVTFTYVDNVLSTVSDGTRIWRYRYVYSPNPGAQGFPFLKEVERPDGRKWVFEYNLVKTQAAGAFSMRRLQYPTGGWFDYEYGFVSFNWNLPRTTVVSKKTDSYSNKWDFAYAPATKLCTLSGTACAFDADSVDRTTVFAPDGVTEYEHVGANSVRNGFVWAIGLPINRVVDQGQEIEVNRWAPQVVSNVQNNRPSGLPSISDNAIGAPLNLMRRINRNGKEYVTQSSNFDEFGNARTVAELGPSSSPDAPLGVQGRTTQRTFYTDPTRWILHVPKDETVSTIPGSVVRDFDSNANLKSETRYGVTTSYTYHPTGEVWTKTDARNKAVTFLNYWRGIPRHEEHPEGVTIDRVVDDQGNVRSEADAEGSTTQYTYDGLNRITLITHSIGNPVRVDWLDTSRVVTRGTYVGTSSFDGFGRVTSVSHRATDTGAEIIQRFINDAYGRQTYASYPNAAIGTRTTYDLLGRVVRQDHAAPETGGTGPAFAKKYFTGADVEVTNERGFVYRYVNNGYGNPDKLELFRIATPGGLADTTITRNGLGQPRLVTQGGVTRQFVYDTKYFLRQQIDPETGATLFDRDEVGNMTSRKVGASGTTLFTYDDRNRLRTITYPAGTPNVTRMYYRDDRLKSVDNGVALREYSYDLNKNLKTERVTTSGRIFELGYAYNDNDALASITYGSGRIVTYQPDAFGRPTKALPYASTIEHHPSGAIKRMVYANGVETTQTLDARQWTETIVAGAGAGAVSSLRYDYDPIGNVSSMQDSVSPSANRTLTYDALDRLLGMPSMTSATIIYAGSGDISYNPLVSSTAGPVRRLSYTSNRVSKLDTVVPPSFTFSQTLSYDNYGNVTGRGSTSFAYNDAQQMRCALCGDPNETQYVYDGEGMRVSSTQLGRTTFFFYGSGGNLMWDVAPSGEVREYVYVGGKQVAVRKLTQ